MLHIISNIENDTLNQCIEVFDKKDCVVFLIDSSFNQEQLNSVIATITTKVDEIYAVLCRPEMTYSWSKSTAISSISYEEFVLLCTQYTPIQTWY